MSTHPGSSFACEEGEGRVGGEEGGEEGGEGEGRREGRGGVRSTASSAVHIGDKELCVTLFLMLLRWLFVDGCC